MLQRSSILHTVREKGNVFFRNSLSTVRAKVASSTPLLQERPYPLAEITKRMVRIRVKYESSLDETEMRLLRGEYKFYTGKAVHLRDASVTDLVAMVSCAGFFGFWDTSLLDRILEILAGRMEELSTLELAQLAQDLPLVDRTRSPQMRAVFKLLCANNCERIREELSFEDHLDLIDNAVGNHCPLVFVTTLLELVDPFIPGYAAFLENNNNNNNNNGEVEQEDQLVLNQNNEEDSSSGIIFKSEGLLNLLETVLLAQNLFEKRMAVLSSRRGGAAMVEKETAKFEPLKFSLIRRLKQQLMSNAKDQMEGNFDLEAIQAARKKNIHNSSEKKPADKGHTPGYLKKETDSDLFPLMAPSTMARTFHALASLSGASSSSSSSSFLDEFTAHKILEYFWTSSILSKLSCADCLELCLTYVETFGITKFFEEEFLIPVAQKHMIENISFLDVIGLNNVFEFIALFALEASSSSSSKNNSTNNRTRQNILDKHLLVTSELFDAALDHALMLKDAGGNAAIWPPNFLLSQLKSLSVIVTCWRREQELLLSSSSASSPTLQQKQHQEKVVVKEFSHEEEEKSLSQNQIIIIQYHRPKLQAVVKSLCGTLISLINTSVTPQDCCTFLGIVATMDDYVLDSSVAAMIKRLVKNWNVNLNSAAVAGHSGGGNNNSSEPFLMSDEELRRELKQEQQQQQQNENEDDDKKDLASLCYLEELSPGEINDLLTLWTCILEENNNTGSSLDNDGASEVGRKIRVHPLVQSMLIPALKSAQKNTMMM